jgi:hypothetical protein
MYRKRLLHVHVLWCANDARPCNGSFFDLPSGTDVFLSIASDSTFGRFSVSFAGREVEMDGYSISTNAVICKYVWSATSQTLTNHTVTVRTIGPSTRAPPGSTGTFLHTGFL